MAALEGDFPRVPRILGELEKSAPDQRLARAAFAIRLEVGSAEEMGQPGLAADAAARYVERADGLVAPFFPHWDETPLCLAVAARGKRLSADDASRRRGAWIRRWESRAPQAAWFLAYGPTAADAGLREEARSKRPATGEFAFTVNPMTRFDAGVLLLALGDRARGTELLRVCARTCLAPADPFRSTRAHLKLGEIFEADGAKDRAIAHYRVVVERWGRARPRSVSAERAKVRLAALGA
jgi:eukaryotic-like serine/threonine-protein kinase